MSTPEKELPLGVPALNEISFSSSFDYFLFFSPFYVLTNVLVVSLRYSLALGRLGGSVSSASDS